MGYKNLIVQRWDTTDYEYKVNMSPNSSSPVISTRYTIHDICLTERLLQNGIWGLKETVLDDVFELYAQHTDMEILTNTNVTISLSQMIQIYQ